jgi:hypothetical protein
MITRENLTPSFSDAVEFITVPVRITFPDNTELWTTINPQLQDSYWWIYLFKKMKKGL